MNKTSTPSKTLRLLMPQWQGGDNGSPFPGQIYPLGAKLLAFLAPVGDSPIIEVPVAPYTGGEPPKSNGILWEEALLKQLAAARKIIEEHQPDRIITFGGDCLVSQAPFAYLNEKYHGDLGIVWIDTHPDITTPANFDHAHAMVLGNLLGEGVPALAKEVKCHFKAEQVLLVGVNDVLPHEQKTIQQLGLRTIPTQDVAENSDVVLQWLNKRSLKKIVIHVDLDVLDPRTFYSQLLNNPNTDKPYDTFAGKMTIAQLTRVVKEVSQQVEVVAISFAEHMPWDALNLKNMMAEFAFMR